MLSRISVIKYKTYEAFAMQLLWKFALQSVVDYSNCDVYLQLKQEVFKVNIKNYIPFNCGKRWFMNLNLKSYHNWLTQNSNNP
jgi:hypothetical protein